MKNNILTTIVAIAIYISTSAQTVHRVNNRTDLENPIQGTNVYTTFNAAYDAAANGDIIYLEGSPISYGDIDLFKQIHIIGPGYLLDENLETQQYTNSAKINIIQFKSGSDGAAIQSLEVNDINILDGADNITISGIYVSSTVPNIITTNAGSDNIIIEKSFLQSNSNTGTVIFLSSGSNLIIRNNILIRLIPSYYAIALSSGGVSGLSIKNNTILGRITTLPATSTNVTLMNNILIDGLDVDANFQFYNLGNANQFNAGDGNQNNIDMTTIFEMTGDPKSDSEYYNIKAGSPTIGAGFEGTDVGHWGGGGDFPYVKSGLIGFPAIYEATVPGITSGTLNIEIKTKSH